MDLLAAALINGVAIGSVYALVGLGLTLLYRCTRVLNFAHGEAVMVGGYAGLVFYTRLGLPYPLTALIAAVCGAAMGMIMDLLLRRLVKASMIALVIATIGFSFFIKGATRIVMTPQTWTQRQVFTGEPLGLIGIPVAPQSVYWLSLLLGLVLLGYLLLFKTKVGLGMRSVSENLQAASLMGVSVGGVFRVTWILSLATAAIAGLAYSTVTEVHPDVGIYTILKAFAAAVIGGFGSLPGVILGGWILGVVENLITIYVSSLAGLYMPFLVLFLILVIKPTGLFGEE